MADVVFTVGSDIKAFTAGMNKLHAEVQAAAGRAEARFSKLVGSPMAIVKGAVGVTSAYGLAAKAIGGVLENAKRLEDQVLESDGATNKLALSAQRVEGAFSLAFIGAKRVVASLLGQIIEITDKTDEMYANIANSGGGAYQRAAITNRGIALERDLTRPIVRSAEDAFSGDGLSSRLREINDRAAADMAKVQEAMRPFNEDDRIRRGFRDAEQAIPGRALDEALAALEEAFAKDDDAAAKLYEQTQKTVEAEKERADAKARAAAATEEDIALSLKLSEAGRLRAVGLSAEARELEAQVRTQKQLADIARDGNLSAEARARLSGQVIRDAQLNAVADRLGGQGSVRDGGSFGRDVVGGLSASAGTLGVFSGGVVQPAQRAVQIGEAQLKAIEVMRDLVLRITNTGLKSVAVAG